MKQDPIIHTVDQQPLNKWTTRNRRIIAVTQTVMMHDVFHSPSASFPSLEYVNEKTETKCKDSIFLLKSSKSVSALHLLRPNLLCGLNNRRKYEQQAAQIWGKCGPGVSEWASESVKWGCGLCEKNVIVVKIGEKLWQITKKNEHLMEKIWATREKQTLHGRVPLLEACASS